MEGGRELADLLLEFHFFISREFGAREQDCPEAEISTLWSLLSMQDISSKACTEVVVMMTY